MSVPGNEHARRDVEQARPENRSQAPDRDFHTERLRNRHGYDGTWPFGRRPEDQVATRFLSVFLDMAAGCGGRKCTVETLGDQALWNAAPIVPKTPPNPLKNDKPFLKQFPYLADPW